MQANRECELYCKDKFPVSRFYDSPYSWQDLYGYGEDDNGNMIVYLCWENPPVRKFRRLRVRENNKQDRTYFIYNGDAIYLDVFSRI